MTKVVHYERGRILDAPPETVACLWSNWEIYDAMLGRRFHAKRSGENEWIGRYLGFSGRCMLVSREASLDRGKFLYRFYTSIMGLPAATVVVLRYVAIGGTSTSVFGEFDSELGLLPSLIEPMVRGRVQQFVDEVIEGGQITTERIAKDYARLREELPEEYVKIIDSYLLTARKLREYPFENPLLAPSAVSNSPSAEALPTTTAGEIKELAMRIHQLEVQIGTLAEDLERSIAISRIDLASGLMANRRIVERLTRNLFESEVGRPADNRMLGQLLQELRKHTKRVPRVIIAHINTVLELGNIGAHGDPLDGPRGLRQEDFEVSLSALLFIVEWYFLQYKSGSSLHDSGSTEPSKE